MIPLFTGGYNFQNTRQAENELTEQYDVLDSTRLTVKNDTQTNFNQMRLLVKKIYADHAALSAAVQTQQATWKAYKLGSRTMLDVSNANQAVMKAELADRQDIYQYLLTSLELKLLTGSLGEQDLSEMDRMFSTSSRKNSPVGYTQKS